MEDQESADSQPTNQFKPLQFFAFEEVQSNEDTKQEDQSNQKANANIGFHLAIESPDQPIDSSPSFNVIGQDQRDVQLQIESEADVPILKPPTIGGKKGPKGLQLDPQPSEEFDYKRA